MIEDVAAVSLRLLHFGRQIVDVDLRPASGERDGALDGVLELANVAGPVIGHQPAHALLRHRDARQAIGRRLRRVGSGRIALGFELRQKMLDEQRDVFFPLAQRRQLHRDHVQPVEEILTELPFGDQLREVAVGRCDHPNVDLDRVRVADALELTLLQHAQQLHLQRPRSSSRLRRGTACPCAPARAGPDGCRRRR